MAEKTQGMELKCVYTTDRGETKVMYEEEVWLEDEWKG